MSFIGEKNQSEKSQYSIIDKNENEINYVDASVSNANLITEINKNLNPFKKYTEDFFEDCKFENIITKNFNKEKFLKDKNGRLKKLSKMQSYDTDKNSLRTFEFLKSPDILRSEEKFRKQKASENKIKEEIKLLREQISIKNIEEKKFNNTNREGKFYRTSYNENIYNEKINNFRNSNIDKVNFNKTTGINYQNYNQNNNQNIISNNFYNVIEKENDTFSEHPKDHQTRIET